MTENGRAGNFGIPPTLTQPALSPAQAALAGRLFVLTGENFRPTLQYINTDAAGAVFTGRSALEDLRKARSAFPQMPMIAEPTSATSADATTECPFILPDPGIFETSLKEVLDAQRSAGANLVLLPAGYVRAKATKVLRAIGDAANEVSGDDLALLLTLDGAWLSDEDIQTVIAVIRRSQHPVLVAFGDPTRPVGSLKRWRAYRKLFASAPWAIPWRSDLAGIDAVAATGARAAAIGMSPSLRRATPPGKKGVAGNKADRSPHMLVADRLLYVKSSTLRDLHIAHPAPVCVCRICGGARIDRLYDSTPDRLQGDLHGVLEIQRLHDGLRAADDPENWWRELRASAASSASSLGQSLGRPIDVPDHLLAWEKLDQASGT